MDFLVFPVKSPNSNFFDGSLIPEVRDSVSSAKSLKISGGGFSMVEFRLVPKSPIKTIAFELLEWTPQEYRLPSHSRYADDRHHKRYLKSPVSLDDRTRHELCAEE